MPTAFLLLTCSLILFFGYLSAEKAEKGEGEDKAEENPEDAEAEAAAAAEAEAEEKVRSHRNYGATIIFVY